jgi:hypothetical protein
MNNTIQGKKIITPEIAREWLKRNKKNRNICITKVKNFSKMMALNQWNESSSENIAFDTDGNLINGQHRLMAIIDSNSTLELNVCYNCRKDSILFIDQGGRTIQNAFQINGVNKAGQVVAIIKGILVYKKTRKLESAFYTAKDEKGNRTKNSIKSKEFNITNIDIHNYYEDNKEFINNIIENYSEVSTYKSKNKPLTTTYCLKFAAILEDIGVNKEDIYSFLKKLIQEEEGVESIKQIRHNYFSHKIDARFKLSSFTQIEYLIRAWNKFMTNDNTRIKLQNRIPELIMKKEREI